MANSFFIKIQELISIVGTDSFQGQCLNNLGRVTSNYTDWSNITLVGQQGNILPGSISDAAWGISYQSCVATCDAGQVKFPFDYGTFANSMTNYLLPWLALTAQLPYETGDPWANVMAFCMAVGSPVLITYSLTLTILNRSWARNYFKNLKLKASLPIVRRRTPDYDKRVDSAQFLLQEAQQVPLRCSQERGWLASLIVLPQNIDWWERLEDRLRGTRRGFSPSLVAQMGLAIIAWLLTVIAAFIALLGDPTTALQIASSSLWTWLVPVIIGWILVGSQITDHSIEDSLRANAFVARERPADVPLTSPPSAHRPSLRGEGDTYVEESHQRGIERRGGLSPQDHVINRNTIVTRDSVIGEDTTVTGNVKRGVFVNEEDQTETDLRVRGWLGFDIGGDEEIKGPTYNYARIFTWWQVVNTVGTSLDTTLNKIIDGRPCELQTHAQGNTVATTPVEEPMRFQAFSRAISQYCGLDVRGSCKQYPDWNDLPAEVFRRIFAAALIAVFVQWGTAGDSIMTAYLTPTVGLGCRSGSYLIYACASTLAWLFLLVASLFSHQAMLQYQSHVLHRDGTGFRRPSIQRGTDPREYDRPMKHTMICAAAVIFRLLGKAICIANTLWLLLTSVLEFVGGFDNCWCMGVVPSRGMNGYVVLFKTATDLANASAAYWGGGLAFIVIVVSLAIVVFGMGTWKPDS